ncbi:efflux RND transporter periplasmic adaptor subunit [Woodsholea maritima]|uniref:efflux RND transporter periplasmic adaptor subunit n=1 Tax=Woodsholea maritima TaxID=240237 RepID=UPI00037C8C21|nr:efflux RND transporter periplasmic adaptor subunit [Woodsholea maritima]
MKRAGFLWAVLALFVVMSAVVLGKMVLTPSAPQGGPRGGAMPVAAFEVPNYPFADTVAALGTARANETVTITARVSDTISRINFESGDQVAQNQILVELTDTEEAADLTEARTTVREASRELERIHDLVSRGVVSQSRLDEVQASVDRARARVASIEARLADRIVRAPFAGVVGLREVSLGELVGPGDAIANLDDTGIIKLDFTLPERFLAVVSAGMEIAAQTSAYPDEVFVGLISQVDTRIDPVTRTVTVRAQIDNAEGRLLPGQLMTVEVRRDMRSNPAVPGASLTRYLDQTYVFVVMPGEGERPASVRRQDIEIGMRANGLVEVTQGLEPGMMIVGEGVHRIRDGMPVMVTRTDHVDVPQSRQAAASLGTGSVQ